MSVSDLESCDKNNTNKKLIEDDHNGDNGKNDNALNKSLTKQQSTERSDDKTDISKQQSTERSNIETVVSKQQSTAERSNAEFNVFTQANTTNQFLSIPYGLVLRATYEHGKRHTEIMGVTYNERMRQFIVLDTKGIITWKRDAVEARVHQALSYPKYEHRLITNMVYAKKYNCYFILGRDFSLKVYNREFIETCSVNADLRSVLFMLFNPIRDELITGGVGGTKVWRFHQKSGNTYGDLKTHASFGLTLKHELPNVGGSWVKRVELDHQMEHLYFCSEHDLYIYDLEGKLLFKFERAHSMAITGCRYSINATVLVTSSLDTEGLLDVQLVYKVAHKWKQNVYSILLVKVWSLVGGLVHTFRGHSRAVTNLILHPMTSSIIVTCSLDGTVRMWSLDTMDCLYSLVVSVDGIQWMGLTDDNLLYLSTPRTLTLWYLNYTVQFWALARSPVTEMDRCGCQEKTTRIMVVSEDSSVRLMARSNSKCLTTLLPPPDISPLQKVKCVCYSRQFNIIYMLINSHEIWVYTARTDPACRIAVWHMIDIQRCFTAMLSGMTVSKDNKPILSAKKSTELHKTTETHARKEGLARCCCVAILASAVIVWTNVGYCCPTRDSYLLMGLEDGRIIFMDPVIKGHKHMELKTGKDPILNIYHDVAHNGLVTLHPLKGMVKILVWSLPHLTLQHEVYAESDLVDFARESDTLVTVHESGCVIFHTLEPAGDPSLKARIPTYEEVMKVKHKPEHLTPVIAVDVCVTLRLFCSCSDDGTIKIWYNRVLLTEIMLDSSLSTACFLNNRGDLLVGYQKHVFYIDHTKVCPQLTVPESDIDTFDKESYICEEPSVLYEGVTPNYDQVTLDNYLVPFDVEISKNFLEGRVALEPEDKIEEVSDVESESYVSVAPTEIYLSPGSTPPRRLSFVDLILSSEVSNHDLLNHTKKTLEHLKEKKKQDAAQLSYEKKWKQKIAKKRKGHNRGGVSSKVKDRSEFNEKVKKAIDVRFSFPRCGESSKTTPESSRPTTPERFSESEEELSKLDVAVEEIHMITETKRNLNVADNEITQKDITTEGMPAGKPMIESFTQKTKFGFSDVKVDADTLMKNTKKAAPTVVIPKRRPEPVQQQIPLESTSDVGQKKSGSREVHAKKSMVSVNERKKSKQQGKMESKDEPSAEIQTSELIEQDSSFCCDSLTEEDEVFSEKQGTESSFSPTKELDSTQSSASDLTREAMKNDNMLTFEISVPALPCATVTKSSQDISRPLISKSITTNKSSIQSVTHLSKHPNRQKNRNESDELEGNILNSNRNDNSRTVTADSAIQIDYISVASTESKDEDSASRIGLMYKEKQDTKDLENKTSPSMAAYQETDEIRSMTTSDFWDVSEVKSQTQVAIETPDFSHGHLLYWMSSNNTCQPPANSPEPRFEYESLSESQEDFVQSESGSHDLIWMDRDVTSASTCRLKLHDQCMSKMSDLSEHQNLGSETVENTQEQTEEIFVPSQAIEVKTIQSTHIEDSILDKPEFQNMLRYFRQRPRTAQMEFDIEDLQTVFEASKLKYKKMIRPPLTGDKQSDNREFSENWHEKQIERHMLIRMQKELREQNVHKKRQMMKYIQQEKQRKHAIEEYFADRRNSSPQVVASTYHRTSMNLSNQQTINIVAPTPISSRPHTAIGAYSQLQQKPQKQLKQQLSLTLQQQQKQLKQNRDTRQQQVKINPHRHSVLGNEKTFRFKLREQQEYQVYGAQPSSDNSLQIDPWLLDSRSLEAMRPRSSNSIPSKCHRYVLVTKPKTIQNFPLPTRLEKYLLAIRFPRESERICKRSGKLLLSGSLGHADGIANRSF